MILRRFVMDRRSADFATMATMAGCEVRVVEDVSLEGAPVVSVLVACDSNQEAMTLLNMLAPYYAREDRQVKALARALLEAAEEQGLAREPDVIGRMIHEFVRNNVAFEAEEIETFRAPDVTLRIGYGDCDDHAVLCAAVAIAAGLPARVVGFCDESGDVTHVAAAFTHGGREHVCETTLEAQGGAAYGEAPRDALRRLGVTGARPDVG